MSRNEKAFVILIPGFPENEADGNCLPFHQQFVLSLKDLYPQLNIIILGFQYPYFKKTYKWHDVTVISFDGRNKGGLSRLFLRRKLIRALQDIHDKNKIAGLLSFWYGECAWVGKRFADKYKLPHYCWLMGQDAKKENKYPGRVPLKADELIALSDFLQDELERNHGVRPRYVIPPGIDNSQYNNISPGKDIDILATGSLIPLKQFEIFVEVVAEVKKQLPAVKAMLIGNGPERKKLQNLIAKYELEKNITLTGELPHPEVLEWMQRTKVFLHPSSYEGFGVVSLEALYGGAAVISFVKPMKRDIKNWHMVNTKEEMSQMTSGLLHDPGIDYIPVIPFTLSDTVRAVARLFNYAE
ncbi:MAG: glycosyltransferase family 4 protein [Bacteroidota bacterium]|nr:glycosyltransferase family 4 protein [Bacteroidota bacterium]